MTDQPNAPESVEGFLEKVRETVDERLDRVLPPESAEPARLHASMRYSVFAGGKRVRPALVYA